MYVHAIYKKSPQLRIQFPNYGDINYLITITYLFTDLVLYQAYYNSKSDILTNNLLDLHFITLTPYFLACFKKGHKYPKQG